MAFYPNTNTYGYEIIESVLQYQNTMTVYYTFNLSQILTQKITKVTLENQRLNYRIATGPSETSVALYNASANVETIFPQLYNPYLIVESGTSGTIRRDITTWFTTNYKARLSGNLIGMAREPYNSPTPQFVITDDIYTYLEFETQSLPSYPPTSLFPITTQNPRSPIQFIWVFARNPEWVSTDPQTGWELTIWQDGLTPRVITQYNNYNNYTLPANTYSGTSRVYFKIRTQTQYNGWGASAQSSFALGATAPLAPVLLFPLNISVPGSNIIPLQWSYNSPYDTAASRFDIRYRFQLSGDAWTAWTEFSNTGQLSAELPQTLTQENVQWQVKAYGTLGDPGPWSDTGNFQIRGVPQAPTIVDVSNSNRPTVFFSITQGIAWQLQILQNDIIVYDTKFIAFDGVFEHQISDLLPNGNYLAQMKVTVGDALESIWSQRPFIIDTISPSPLKLSVSNTLNFSATLYFNNINSDSVYIYRDGIRIAQTNGKTYNDYTSQPKKRHIYSTRNVTSTWAFADSNQVVHTPIFKHTTVARTNNPSDMIKLIYMMDGQPTKDMSYGYATIFTDYLGRDKPVVDIGELETKTLSLQFYISFEDAEKLMNFAKHSGELILRDWRLGVVYGQIDGEIKFSPERNGQIASFTFRETDYPIEVEL